MQDLIQHTPMIRIHLWDKSEIITDKKHEGVIIEAWKKKAVITVGSVTVSGAQISKIEPAHPEDYAQLSVPEQHKAQIKVRSKAFHEGTGRQPSNEVVNGWVIKLSRGEKI